jgi:hypothetical protein
MSVYTIAPKPPRTRARAGEHCPWHVLRLTGAGWEVVSVHPSRSDALREERRLRLEARAHRPS